MHVLRAPFNEKGATSKKLALTRSLRLDGARMSLFMWAVI